METETNKERIGGNDRGQDKAARGDKTKGEACRHGSRAIGRGTDRGKDPNGVRGEKEAIRDKVRNIKRET